MEKQQGYYCSTGKYIWEDNSTYVYVDRFITDKKMEDKNGSSAKS